MKITISDKIYISDDIQVTTTTTINAYTYDNNDKIIDDIIHTIDRINRHHKPHTIE